MDDNTDEKVEECGKHILDAIGVKYRILSLCCFCHRYKAKDILEFWILQELHISYLIHVLINDEPKDVLRNS